MHIVQLWAAGVRFRWLDHRDRSLQGEVQHGLRGELDLLTLAGGLFAPTDSGARRSADHGTLSAAGDGTDDAAQNCATADFFRSILALRTAFFSELIRLQVVAFAVRRDAIELQQD